LVVGSQPAATSGTPRGSGDSLCRIALDDLAGRYVAEDDAPAPHDGARTDRRL